MHRFAILAVITVAAAGLALAQQGTTEQHDVVFQRFVTGGPGPGPDALPPPGGPGHFGFVSAEMVFEGKTVTGAPFSADAVNETVQTLADGNRISQTSKGLIARDSAGRVHREQTLGLGMIGSTSQEAAKLVFINDPVSQTSYVLEPDHTARKMALNKGLPPPPPPGASASSSGGTTIMIRRDVRSADTGSLPVPTSESLGQQTIEGVAADGTRTTITIAAGSIGNEKEIKIVDETWFSKDLQTVVLSTHSDPRMGTTTFRLANIQRSEPSADLFQVPSDYTVRDTPKAGEAVHFEYRTQQK